MQLADHGNIQWLALAVALGLMLLWLSRMQPEALPASTHDTPPAGAAHQVNPGSNGGRCPAAVLAGLVVMCVAGVTAGFTSSPTWAAVQLPSGELPSEMAGWRLGEPLQPQATSPTQDTATQTLLYRRQGRDLRVTVTQARSIQAKLSEEALSPGTHATWQDIRRDTPRDCSTIGCAGLRHTVWRLDRKTPLRHIYHAYSVGDFDTDSKLALRAATAWHRLTGHAVGARLIVMAIDGDEPTREDMTTLYHAIRVALNDSPAAAERAP